MHQSRGCGGWKRSEGADGANFRERALGISGATGPPAVRSRRCIPPAGLSVSPRPAVRGGRGLLVAARKEGSPPAVPSVADSRDTADVRSAPRFFGVSRAKFGRSGERGPLVLAAATARRGAGGKPTWSGGASEARPPADFNTAQDTPPDGMGGIGAATDDDNVAWKSLLLSLAALSLSRLPTLPLGAISRARSLEARATSNLQAADRTQVSLEWAEASSGSSSIARSMASLASTNSVWASARNSAK